MNFLFFNYLKNELNKSLLCISKVRIVGNYSNEEFSKFYFNAEPLYFWDIEKKGNYRGFGFISSDKKFKNSDKFSLAYQEKFGDIYLAFNYNQFAKDNHFLYIFGYHLDNKNIDVKKSLENFMIDFLQKKDMPLIEFNNLEKKLFNEHSQKFIQEINEQVGGLINAYAIRNKLDGSI
ncbi:MAG: hypothetical protein ACMXX8_03330 [Candidatus Woesearchaeota archaeon]